jgi:hypothetical protein
VFVTALIINTIRQASILSDNVVEKNGDIFFSVFLAVPIDPCRIACIIHDVPTTQPTRKGEPMTIWVSISKISPNLEPLDILEERPKALRVRNQDTGLACWLPKSGLSPRRPGEPTYENEFVLRRWFRDAMSLDQERALNIAE